MKIAQIVCVYPPYKSGISTSADNSARLLKLGGQDVVTFTIDYGGKKSLLLSKEGQGGGFEVDKSVVRLKAFPRLGNGGLVIQLFWRLRAFDIIYLHYPFFGATEIIWFLKKFIWKNKKKLVIQYHMDAVLSSFAAKILGWPSALIFKSLFRQADKIISASFDYVQNGNLANIFQEAKDKFVEIPYGIDSDKFKPAAGNKAGAFKVLFVGGLDRAHYFKGLKILLSSLAELKKEKKDFVLDIVGSGDLRESYALTAKELGIGAEVVFSEKVSDEELPEKYRSADVLVLPSINKGEAFGIVLVEAMASGVPVIASDLPGVRGVFTAGVQGLLVRPGDVSDLKEKIQSLMNDQSAREKMGKAARVLAEEKYDLEKIGDRLNEEIKKL